MKYPRRPVKHVVDVVFTLLLFGVFLTSTLMIVLIGAQVYRNATANMTENFGVNTSITYVATKIHQNDRLGAVYVEPLGEVDALVLEEQFGDTVYQTWIYYHDGSLREVFTPKEVSFEPENGTAIIEVSGFSVQQITDNMFRFTSISAQGTPVSMTVATRC